MKTDDLIVQLAGSAGPVTPLPRPALRLLLWMAMATVLAAGGLFVFGVRADFSSAILRPAFGTSLTALLLATVSSAAAAFVLSVPGAERSPLQRAVPIATALVWPAAWLVPLILATTPVHARLFHMGCAVQIAAIGVTSGWVLIAMLRRAAALQPGWTAAFASLAAVSIASAATQVICPIDSPAHQLAGHVLVAVVTGAAGFAAGRHRLTTWGADR